MSFVGSSHLNTSDSFRHHDERIRSLESSKPSLLMEHAQVAVPAAVPSEHDADNMEDDPQSALFKELYARSEARLAALFGGPGVRDGVVSEDPMATSAQLANEQRNLDTSPEVVPKKAARNIDEDDYDDEDDEEDEEENTSPLRKKSTGVLPSPSKSGSSPIIAGLSPTKQSDKDKQEPAPDGQPKTSEDVRKQLEAAKKATEDAVKRSLNTIFYTLENDRVAMLEQQKLEESEKQIDAEMDHGRNAHAGGVGANGEHHGTLSSANLGASSLTLKHLIARIDFKRDQVQQSDAELRSLMNEVRKNRSKWASEEFVHQEELYEAAEKVLSELKAMTEYSAPFLTRVNKRDAPDYYNFIKTPMDLGTMTKKLKTLVYKSKAEFVADLDLIWSNCLKYNADLTHHLRRNANSMRKEAEKLVPLIPDLVIRTRAEVEAEERRKQNGTEDDGADESDDEPIMSSRGRKAPGKTGVKGSTKARKVVPGREEGTPGVEQKPSIHLNGIIGNLIYEGSEFGREGSTNGFGTPTGANGVFTPGLMNGMIGSQLDAMDIDGPSINGISLGHALGVAADDLQEDEEYKIWKQVTKRDRALAAKERNRLFKGDKLNPDEPALLRTKTGMRRWLRQQTQADEVSGDTHSEGATDAEKKQAKGQAKGSETLAEGMEGDEERALPDYYDPLSSIPDIPKKLQWIEDDHGQVVDQSEEFLRMVPPGHFTAPQSALTAKIEANMRQMQETRKICSKIGVVKQMQLQSQMYNNQFQKYSPQPFVEADIEPHISSDDGAIMSTWVCRAAFQRSIGKICYHTGFEELQPSALDVITDLAGDYFTKLARTFTIFRETPKVEASNVAAEAGLKWQPRFSNEETILHTLDEMGMDIESLESYARDENERFGTKLGIMHERMKATLAELLRPALVDVGADGAGAFNDGSDQFIGGDFAEDLDEDFFGFKELGLDKEFGLATLSVPLHLLQSKMAQAHNLNNASASTAAAMIFAPLPPLVPVTKENIQNQIGLVKNFFLAKLHANSDEPLIEDEDLPMKQRFPKPRLPPTGKITSPRKRPLKEQAGNAKKKKKLENGVVLEFGGSKATGGSPEKGAGLGIGASGAVLKKLKSLQSASLTSDAVSMERVESQGNASFTEKDDGSAVGMMSPESIER